MCAAACARPLHTWRPESLPERGLSRLWYGGAFARPGLRTRCGRRVRVHYRGLPNGERGPDYLGAVVSLGRGRPRAGDVELHVRTSHWRAHGHHLDPRYDGVILHVVWEDDDPSPTVLASGRQAPVLALGGLPSAHRPNAYPGEPCRWASGRDPERLAEVLDRAGEERFLGKAARLEGDMAVLPAAEVLYQALAEALGYSQNKEAFRSLAASLPLASLEGFLWAVAPGRREALAEALLLGCASLLPSQRGLRADGEWPADLERLWKGSGLVPCLIPGGWSLGVRPENQPVRRVAGLASLVVDSLGTGIVSWALGLLGTRIGSRATGQGPTIGSRVKGQGSRWKTGAAPGPRTPDPGPGLDPGPWTLDPREGDPGPWTLDPRESDPGPWTLDPGRLRRPASGYWSGHFDFGRPGSRLSRYLIGMDRATTMAANALLPFAYAYGQLLAQEELSRSALEAFAHLPSPEDNQIVRHMFRQLQAGSGTPLARSARRQQGLLHLFHSYCTRGSCSTCPVH